jgi:hypothetical protein
MKCTYHPNKDAVTKCSQCQKPLCDECAASGNDQEVVCSRCAILLAAQDASLGVDERGEEREDKRQAMEAKGKRKSRVLLLVVVSFAAIVLIANLYFYLKVDVPDAKEFDPYEDLELTADLINDAVVDYAEGHGGRFPEKLRDIPAKYLPSEKITSSVFEKFSYTRSSPYSYELRLKDSVGGTDVELVFTEEDL